MITLRRLGLRRGAKLLLEGADLALHPGERVGVIGPNGCGKSSLFALLRGELHPDAGDVDLPPRWASAARTRTTRGRRSTATRRARAPRRCSTASASRRPISSAASPSSRAAGGCVSTWPAR